MRKFPLKVLLLGLFAFWATGAAQFVHERVEHRHASDCGGCTSSLQSGSAIGSETPAGHSHEQCAVCAIMASMAANCVAMASLIAAPRPRTIILQTSDWDAPAAAFVQFPLSRGPPIL